MRRPTRQLARTPLVGALCGAIAVVEIAGCGGAEDNGASYCERVGDAIDQVHSLARLGAPSESELDSFTDAVNDLVFKAPPDLAGPDGPARAAVQFVVNAPAMTIEQGRALVEFSAFTQADCGIDFIVEVGDATPGSNESAQSELEPLPPSSTVPPTGSGGPDGAFEQLLNSPLDPSVLPSGITSAGPVEFVFADGGPPGPGTVDYRLVSSSGDAPSAHVTVFENLADSSGLFDGVRVNLDQYTDTRITDMPVILGEAYCYADEFEGSRCLARIDTLVIDVRAGQIDPMTGLRGSDNNLATAVLRAMVDHVASVLD